MSWTDERVTRLRKLVANKCSAGQIAMQIGCSRNAVIGKVARLGLSFAGSTKRLGYGEASGYVRVRRPRLPKPKLPRSGVLHAPREPLPPTHVDDVARVSLIDREDHQCHWPVGDPQQPGFGYCGLPAQPGLVYCAGHVQRAYVPVQPRRSGNPSPSYTQTVVRLHPPVSADERESVLETA